MHDFGGPLDRVHLNILLKERVEERCVVLYLIKLGTKSHAQLNSIFKLRNSWTCVILMISSPTDSNFKNAIRSEYLNPRSRSRSCT